MDYLKPIHYPPGKDHASIYHQFVAAYRQYRARNINIAEISWSSGTGKHER
jgi:hypothetical protein